MPAPPATAPWDWIVALTFIFSFFAAFGNGANDVANSYASSVAARTLKMWHVGILAMFTEFIGAFALGARVTDTIKNGIMTPDAFFGNPAVFMLVMACAEVANATWLMTATGFAFPVSTTQTIVGALVGAGIAIDTPIQWGWASGSVTQIIASWFVAPAISCVFGAALFGTIKFGILARGEDAFKWALRAIPFYLAFTGAILALFIVIEAPGADSLEEMGAGVAIGIVLGTFFGVLALAYIFFMPYIIRRLVQQDGRLQWYHIPLGPLLYMENPPIYWPAKGKYVVKSYYEDCDGNITAGTNTARSYGQEGYMNAQQTTSGEVPSYVQEGPNGMGVQQQTSSSSDSEGSPTRVDELDPEKAKKIQEDIEKNGATPPEASKKQRYVKPYDRFVGPVKHLSWKNPRKVWGYIKLSLLYGVTADVISHDSDLLRAIHARAHRYDDRIEHLWTYAQVVSAMMSSISHGSNDVANAIGPLVGVYETWLSGEVETETDTPIFILAMAGVALGLGFWFFGWRIMRAVGNRLMQFSPTRGFAVELGSSITVLMASRLALPVSTTQCLVGATVGVALMNMDLKAVNWRQVAKIMMGWMLTLPSAGLMAGIITIMAINTPRWDMPQPT